MAGAARAACSSLRAARASGDRSVLVAALMGCGSVAIEAPGEVVSAEWESQEQERLGGSTSYGGLDLSHEGRVILPTTPAALSRLNLAYYEAAVAICDSALTAAGGRGSPAAADKRRVPNLTNEAHARGCLGLCLHELDEQHQHGLELTRQAVRLFRRMMRTPAADGYLALHLKQSLAFQLWNLSTCLFRDHILQVAGVRIAPGSEEVAEAEACLREAHGLCEQAGDMELQQCVLTSLVNMCGQRGQFVEAEAFRSRLNGFDAHTGRIPDTSCVICLELFEVGGSAEKDATGDGGHGAVVGDTSSSIHVQACGHQFHAGCLNTWWRTTSKKMCPLCKE